MRLDQFEGLDMTLITVNKGTYVLQELFKISESDIGKSFEISSQDFEYHLVIIHDHREGKYKFIVEAVDEIKEEEEVVTQLEE